MKNLLQQLGHKTSDFGDKTFYWHREQNPKDYWVCRTNLNCDIFSIPYEEIRNAFLHILMRKNYAGERELRVYTSKLFGEHRQGEKKRNYLYRCIETAVKEKYIGKTSITTIDYADLTCETSVDCYELTALGRRTAAHVRLID